MKYLNSARKISNSAIIVCTAIFLLVFYNFTFFNNVTAVYPLNLDNIPFLISLALVFACCTIIMLALVCHKIITKPLLIIILLASSLAAYFMDSYNVAIDDVMIQNITETTFSETKDLLSIRLLLYLTILWLAPSFFIYRANIINDRLQKYLLSALKLTAISLVVLLSCLLLFGSSYASFFREHKSLRYYANPTYWIYSTIKYSSSIKTGKNKEITKVGLDATIPESDVDRELIVFVLGETARADRFSLNGYARKTNPLLEKVDLVSFSNFWACGTSTSVSVPCIFTNLNGKSYDSQEAKGSENLLDVLTRAGVNVMWLDNNSDSKGVALRSSYEDYSTPNKNSICDVECRDIGMLSDLQAKIDAIKKGDIFIVLHQMGSHGPAYYKRYPDSFKIFTPTCNTNQLEDCDTEFIGNAYDNTILYTDYFLSKVINLLEQNDSKYETAMFYVSDHGESLGENGIYLHGMPNLVAPKAQRHIPAIMWIGKHFDGANINLLRKNADREYTHENVFHTLLGMMEIKTIDYDPQLDIIRSP